MVNRLTRVIAGAALLASSVSHAQTVAVPPKTLQLSKVVIKPQPELKQRVRVGTICLFSGSPLAFGAERTLDFERFERLFATALKPHGFNVLAKSSDLFEEADDLTRSDFMIGATISPTSVDICDSVSGQKGTIAISVEWQIYDRNKRQVVEKVTTPGSGQLPKFEQDGFNAMINQAFTASAKSLVESEAIQKHVGDTRTLTTAP